MNQFNLGNFINRFLNSSLSGFSKGNTSGTPISQNPEINLPKETISAQTFVKTTLTQSSVLTTFNGLTLSGLKMNQLANLERGLYLKNLMNLPKELDEILTMVQNNMVASKEVTKLLAQNISLTLLAEIMQKNGKDAINKLVFVLANASKQGLEDLSQIKDTIKLINASISIASQDNPQQMLKTFMLLYLPWVPLQEGVDFELEFFTPEEEKSESEMIVTILISTINYGNIKVTLILDKSNSIDIIIDCAENFPKKILLERINSDSKNHSIHSNVIFSEKPTKQQTETSPRQAKISVSNLKEINPFLLLMANSIIRHAIELDREKSA